MKKMRTTLPVAGSRRRRYFPRSGKTAFHNLDTYTGTIVGNALLIMPPIQPGLPPGRRPGMGQTNEAAVWTGCQLPGFYMETDTKVVTGTRPYIPD